MVLCDLIAENKDRSFLQAKTETKTAIRLYVKSQDEKETNPAISVVQLDGIAQFGDITAVKVYFERF